jgi:hypothetical protein
MLHISAGIKASLAIFNNPMNWVIFSNLKIFVTLLLKFCLSKTSSLSGKKGEKGGEEKNNESKMPDMGKMS